MSLKETKRRIGSVKNTQKITRAMKLVSSAKYARANQALLGSRPYGEGLRALLTRALFAAGDTFTDPLCEERKEKKALFVVISTDRGLCGGLNGNLFKICQKHLEEKSKAQVDLELSTWGKKACAWGRTKKNLKLKEPKEKVLEKPSYAFALDMAKQIEASFRSKEIDRVYFGYSKFKNAMTQTPIVETLLPVIPQITPEERAALGAGKWDFEPKEDALLSGLLLKYLAIKIFGMLLDASASEHAARMTAMDNATNNAQEVIKSLTLEYNRARQANITKELIEITSGAEALN